MFVYLAGFFFSISEYPDWHNPYIGLILQYMDPIIQLLGDLKIPLNIKGLHKRGTFKLKT